MKSHPLQLGPIECLKGEGWRLIGSCGIVGGSLALAKGWLADGLGHNGGMFEFWMEGGRWLVGGLF